MSSVEVVLYCTALYCTVLYCTVVSSVGADTGKKRLLRHFDYKNTATTKFSLHLSAIEFLYYNEHSKKNESKPEILFFTVWFGISLASGFVVWVREVEGGKRR